MPITVAEIADRSGKGGDRRETFIQRVRHWTRERLLRPIGETNPGTGNHRLYRDTAVYDALILDAMTDKGMPIATQRFIMGIVRQERDLGWRVKEKEKSGLDFFLVIETIGNNNHPYFIDDLQKIVGRRFDDIVVFNLTRHFASIVPQQSIEETNG